MNLLWCNKAVLLFSQSPRKRQTSGFTELFSYRCTCSSNFFMVVLASEDAKRKPWTSFSLFSKAIFKPWTWWSDWRCSSSNSHNCKITARIHTSQVNLYGEESTTAEEYKYCMCVCIPSPPRTIIISSTFKPWLLLANDHKLCYCSIFKLASPIPALISYSTFLSTDTAPPSLSVTCNTLCIVSACLLLH